MNRRGFLRGMLAAATAPFVVTSAGVLMPVRKIWTPFDYDVEVLPLTVHDLRARAMAELVEWWRNEEYRITGIIATEEQWTAAGFSKV